MPGTGQGRVDGSGRAGGGGWVQAEGRNQSRDTGHKVWGVLWWVLEAKGSSRTCFRCGRLSAKREWAALSTSHNEFQKHLCARGPVSSRAWGLSRGHSGRAWVGAPWPALEVLRPRHDSENGARTGGKTIRERIDGGCSGGSPVPVPAVPTPRGPSSQLPSGQVVSKANTRTHQATETQATPRHSLMSPGARRWEKSRPGEVCQNPLPRAPGTSSESSQRSRH